MSPSRHERRKIARQAERKAAEPVETILIHGRRIGIRDDYFEWELSQTWEREAWTPSDVTRYDNHLKPIIIEGDWDHDHCGICGWTLSLKYKEPDREVGYTNGPQWLCVECYEKLIAPRLPRR